ncbi:26S proteasome regulatory subunit 6B [Orobanche minor]
MQLSSEVFAHISSPHRSLVVVPPGVAAVPPASTCITIIPPASIDLQGFFCADSQAEFAVGFLLSGLLVEDCYSARQGDSILNERHSSKLSGIYQNLRIFISQQMNSSSLCFYENIGGCDIQKQEIREAVELPLTHLELYQQIGIDPPMGLVSVLHRAPGS